MSTQTTGWVGRVLRDGRYELTGALGAGGMARVYLARDRRLDCDVVIKVPQAALLQDPEFAARFAREVRSLVRLSHPHVVKVTDVGEEDGSPYAVMQYLAGGSLRERQRLGSDGKPAPCPAEDLHSWLGSVAEALDFIHRQGFVHRDVKPDNILFDAEGHVYLSDFGIAKALMQDHPAAQQTAHTSTGMILGTPRYMPPELLLGQPYDGRADQYGLAVTVYEVLSGRVPFDGPTPTAIYIQQQSPPPSLNSLVPMVSGPVAAAVQRALACDPAQRHQSCGVFAKAVLQGVAVSSSAGNPTASASEGTSPAGTPERTMVQEASAQCPACGKKLRLPATAQGKRVRCTSCRHEFRAPLLSQAAPTQMQPALPGPAADVVREIELVNSQSVEIGKIYEGRVTSVKDFGAFVEIVPGKDGLCHITELAEGYVNSVADVCNVGDEMLVKVVSIDEQGRVKLSRRQAVCEASAHSGCDPILDVELMRRIRIGEKIAAIKLRRARTGWSVLDKLFGVADADTGKASKPDSDTVPQSDKHVPPFSPSVVVSQDGTGNFLTIGDAVIASLPGTCIRIRPGQYEEMVVIDRNLTLVGDAERPISVSITNTNGPSLIMQAHEADVRNLSLDLNTDRASESYDWGRNYVSVEVVRGHLRLHDSFVSGMRVVGPHSEASLSQCDMSRRVFVADSAEARITDCEQSISVEVSKRGKATIRRCRLSSINSRVGPGSSITLEECREEGVHALARILAPRPPLTLGLWSRVHIRKSGWPSRLVFIWFLVQWALAAAVGGAWFGLLNSSTPAAERGG